MVPGGCLHCSCLLLVCSRHLTCCIPASILLAVRSGCGLDPVCGACPVSKSIHLTPNPNPIFWQTHQRNSSSPRSECSEGLRSAPDGTDVYTKARSLSVLKRLSTEDKTLASNTSNTFISSNLSTLLDFNPTLFPLPLFSTQ